MGATSRSRSHSPTGSYITEEPSSNHPKFKYEMMIRTLALRNVPRTWEKTQLVKYIKKHTYDSNEKIAESIQSIILENKENCTLVTFTTQQMAQDAKILLENAEDKVYGKKIIVQFYSQIKNEPGKTATNRDRSRSPIGTWNEDRKEKHHRVLLMSNIPTSWDKNEIEEYVKKHTKSNEAIAKNIQFIFLEREFKNFTGVCLIRFSSPDLCKEARTLLRKVPEVESRKICVDYDFANEICIWNRYNKPDFDAMKNRAKQQQEQLNARNNKSHDNFPNNRNFQSNWFNNNDGPNFNNYQGNQGPENNDNKIFQNDLILMSQEQQTNDTFGLRPQFLDCLGIDPPIGTKVFVGNLSVEYDDETKIRKLFGHAGMVLSVAIIGRHETLKAKVEYDHPVEAVQAITMFHNQELYGKRLFVQMDRSRNATKRFYPDGLKSFGPGLGPNGLPLKGVRSTIELQNVKNMIMSEIASIRREQNYQGNDDNNMYNENQSSMQQNQPNIGMNQQMNMQNPIAALATNLMNPVQNNPLLALGTLLNPQATQMLQLLSQQNTGNNLGAILNVLLNQGINSQTVSSDWDKSQTSDVSQNIQSGFNLNMQNSPNIQGISNMQSGPNVHGGMNIQGGSNSQSAMNVQGGINALNIQGMQNMQGGLNMHTGPNIQGGPNVQSGPNMYTGPNVQGALNIQGGPNVQGGPNMYTGPNVQGALNIQGGPNVQGGPNMYTGPNVQGAQNMQGGSNIQDGPNTHTRLNMQSPLNMQGRPNIQGGPNMQGGTNIQDGPNRHTGPNIQGALNMQTGPNIQSGSLNMCGQNQSNFVGRQSNQNLNDDSERNRNMDNDGSCSVIFNYLPPSVTLQALKSKMQEVGDIKMADMTGPGRAIVVFYSPRDAKACIKLLDRTKVDGQTIDVRHL